MKADVTAGAFVGNKPGQRGQSAPELLGGEHPIFLHTAENVGQPFLRAYRMPVGIEIVRPFGQAGEKRAFLKREFLGGFAEITPRSKLDAPGAAAEIDGIEVKLENLRLAQRLFDTRGHDHLADLAFVGQIFADQQVLDDLLRDRRASLRPSGRSEVANESAN